MGYDDEGGLLENKVAAKRLALKFTAQLTTDPTVNTIGIAGFVGAYAAAQPDPKGSIEFIMLMAIEAMGQAIRV